MKILIQNAELRKKPNYSEGKRNSVFKLLFSIVTDILRQGLHLKVWDILLDCQM